MKYNRTDGESALGGQANNLQGSLIFNIIYIPGMTKHLEVFVSSLLDSTNCRYRLVANGCFRDEQVLLESYCQSEPRLEYYLLSSDHILTHCEALSQLQKMESSSYFCFMDADIYSRGRFLDELLPHLDKYAGIFSASPVWCHPKHQIIAKDWPEMGGRHTHTSEGICLGTSYFAIYDNRVLAEFIESTGITFARHTWGDIPEGYKERLISMGLKKNFYDTGKLLNILIQTEAHKLLFLESESLVHLGAMTEFFAGKVNRMFGGKLPHSLSLRYRHFRKLVGTIKQRFQVMLRREPSVKSEFVYPEYRQMLEIRSIVSTYFLELLLALSNNRPFDKTLDIDNLEVKGNVELAAKGIKAIWKERGSRTRS